MVYTFSPSSDMTEFNLPKEAGFLFDNQDLNHRFFMLRIMYRNIGKELVDHSGVKVHLTHELRKHNAGVMTLGVDNK